MPSAECRRPGAGSFNRLSLKTEFVIFEMKLLDALSNRLIFTAEAEHEENEGTGYFPCPVFKT